LDEGNEKLEKPKRQHENLPEPYIENLEFPAQKCDHADQHNSCENITEKTKRERKNFHEFSDKMEPSNENIDTFFCDVRTSKVENIGANMSKKTLMMDRENLSEKNRRHRHHDRGIEIAIDRPEVDRRRSWSHHKIDPVKDKSENITEKNDKKKSRKKEK
jgi:hypothetical protein